MDVTVNMETYIGPAEVQLAAGQAGVEVLPGSVAVKGPGVLCVGAGHMGITLSLTSALIPIISDNPISGGITGGTLTMTDTRTRPVITRNDCIRSLIDAGREHERWVREAAQLNIAMLDSLDASNRDTITAARDALAHAEAEVAAAREQIRVWVAVAGLLERDA